MSFEDEMVTNSSYLSIITSYGLILSFESTSEFFFCFIVSMSTLLTTVGLIVYKLIIMYKPLIIISITLLYLHYYIYLFIIKNVSIKILKKNFFFLLFYFLFFILFIFIFIYFFIIVVLFLRKKNNIK